MHIGYILAFLSVIMNILGAIESKTENTYYRAAVYTIEIDLTKTKSVASEFDGISYSGPSNSTAYMYIIQYGKNNVIEIMDPVESKSAAVLIDRWDYEKRVKTFSFYLRNLRKYRVYFDSIEHDVGKSIGVLKSLGCGNELSPTCDSINFVRSSTNKVSKVYISDTIPNISSNKLFYPDIKYLPAKIVGVGSTSNTMYLDTLLDGKIAVDSILKLFTFEDYTPLAQNYENSVDKETIKKLIEKMNSNE